MFQSSNPKAMSLVVTNWYGPAKGSVLNGQCAIYKKSSTNTWPMISTLDLSTQQKNIGVLSVHNKDVCIHTI